MAYLELRNISKRFRGTVAVDDLSLEVAEGEMVCLLGPSGCGKTTTLRMIAGFEALDTGSIWLDGRDVSRIQPEKRDIGVVFQNYALFPHLTVAQNIGFGLKMRRRPAREIADDVREALQLVQLEGAGDRFPRELSGGQQQRVALARAIVIRPRMLLLDEPLSNLDAKLRDTMRDEIRRVQRQTGITAIFVTHDQVEALSMADRMAVMDRGRMIQCDTPERLYARPAHPFIAGFIGQANQLQGRVTLVQGEEVSLVCGDGTLLSGFAGAAFQPGDRATAVVKTECVHLLPSGPGITVQILSCSFVGPSLIYTCGSGNHRIVASLPNRPEHRFATGQTVQANWSQSDCLMIPSGQAHADGAGT